MAGTPKFALADFLPFRLSRLLDEIARAFEHVHGAHNLNMVEWCVLTGLGESGEITAKNLGVKYGLHKTKVSRAVTALRQQALVKRQADRDDLRQAFLTLTPQGRRLYSQMADLAALFSKNLENAISSSDRDALDRALSALGDLSQRQVFAPRTRTQKQNTPTRRA